ncbi:MAG: iron complex outermembrane receptor protein [Limisphaerales bacterium]
MFTENFGFLSGFNTPNHRFNLSLGGSSVAGTDFGFDIKYRWTGDYRWESPFGVGDIPAYQVLDLAVFYQFDKIHSVLKAGANNLAMKEYINLYGGPNVGSIFYVGWTFDEILK